MKVLPKVAAEVSAPLSQTEKITMVSDGDGPIGASKVSVYVQMQNNYTKQRYTGAIWPPHRGQGKDSYSNAKQLPRYAGAMSPSSRARY